ncbi:MAG: hypothetical protein IJ906_15115, partial [Oscillospiraceae bacterium]|nr:hypothetical protein [Oscillospiraceae bacterium]
KKTACYARYVLRSIAAQNTSHAFPYAAYSGYKKLNELSFLIGNSMISVYISRRVFTFPDLYSIIKLSLQPAGKLIPKGCFLC